MSMNRRNFMGALGVAAGLSAAGRTPAQSELPVSSRELWEFARLQSVQDASVLWLDSAFAGPSLRRVLIDEYRHREALSADRSAYYRNNLAGEGLRSFLGSVASFLGASPEELTFTSGCTEALNLVAQGLDLNAGDEIVTTQHEHAAAIYPWLLQAKRRGVKVVQVSLPSPLPHPQHVIDAFSAALTPRTRVLAFAHVQYTDGSVLPARELAELARSRNILSVVDGAQALGMLGLTLRDLRCDFYAASLHKWLNGPSGTGVLYLRDAARHRVWPSMVAGHEEWDALDRDGASSSQPSADYRADWPGAMRKFDYSFQHAAPLFYSVLPAIRFQNGIGTARVAARIRELAWYLRLQLQRVTGVRILTSAHPELWAGIVSFQVPGVGCAELARKLLDEHRIAVSAVKHQAMGFDAVRASTHIYNSHDDVDRFVRAVDRLIR
jgi:isopenicillin-N epimerase